MSNYYAREERLINMICVWSVEKPGVVPDVWMGIDEWVEMQRDRRIRQMDNHMPFSVAMASDARQEIWREEMRVIINSDMDQISEHLRKERMENVGVNVMGPGFVCRLRIDYDEPTRVALAEPV